MGEAEINGHRPRANEGRASQPYLTYVIADVRHRGARQSLRCLVFQPPQELPFRGPTAHGDDCAHGRPSPLPQRLRDLIDAGLFGRWSSASAPQETWRTAVDVSGAAARGTEGPGRPLP